MMRVKKSPPRLRANNDFNFVGDETLAQMLERLKVDSTKGLSTQTAEQRLVSLGGNKLVISHFRTKVIDVLQIVASPLVLILLFAGIVSAIVGEVRSAGIIGVIVFLSVILNLYQTFRSERAAKKLNESIGQTATVLRDGVWGEISRQKIVVGDIIRLSAGDLVPADGRLIESKDLHVQQAALTGESFPVEKEADQGLWRKGEVESPAVVYMGTSIVSGVATAVVFATGDNTSFGDIVESISARPEETEFERGIHSFGALILKTVIFLVLFILIINVALGRDAMQSLLFSLALAVGLTPEFLPMITTVTLAQGAIRMAHRKVIVKHLSAIQNLGSMDVLCSDKTGTLTMGAMKLQESVDCFGRKSEQTFLWGYLNSKFESGIKSPVDQAILEHTSPAVQDYVKIDEVPFDFERRRLSIVVQRDQSRRYFISKGAPENIVQCCSMMDIDGGLRPFGLAEKEQTLETFKDLSTHGFRVLGVAYKPIESLQAYRKDDETDLIMVGFLVFADPLSPHVKESLSAMKRDGVRVKILTGDNENVTRRICSDVGIEASRIVLGDEIEKMDGVSLARLVTEVDVFARVSPMQKQRIIRSLKSSGCVVGFLGDGINDAPSLHDADVGISVAGAVDVAREASDIILMERSLEVLHAGIISGRRAFGNVLKYILMGTSSNFGNMFSMAGAAIFLPFLPMLPTQILLNNFLYDLAQISIPSDNVDAAYIRAPHKWDVKLIRNFMLVIGPISSLYDFLTFYFLLHILHFGETQFHTGWFVESLVTQTLVVFVIRTVGKPWSNPPGMALSVTILLAVSVGLILPFSPFADSLGFSALTRPYFYFLVAATITYLAIVEVLKRKIIHRIF